jgi:prephenate dehydratase
MPVVAFQGELGAYSELAAREFFGPTIDVLPSATFLEVFSRVTSGKADAAMIPIENSLAGSIHENYDLLLEHDLTIIGEIKLRIVHNLIVQPGTKLSDIRRVISHPQALAQCQNFLRKLRGAETVAVYDTAGAAREIMESGARDTAAIASAQAAADYNLEMLAESIESNHQNYTRFLVIAKKPIADVPQAEETKTSVAFSLRHQPGALFKGVGVFALRDINLLKIESRPLIGEPWQYLFYLDFAGDVGNPNCAKALDHLHELTSFIRVFGKYPVGRVVDGPAIVDRNNGDPGDSDA